jgi:outer membrane protein OmpA-like peptidoglycan-associated protein
MLGFMPLTPKLRSRFARPSAFAVIATLLSASLLFLAPAPANATGTAQTWSQPGASRPAWNYSPDSAGGNGPASHISLSSIAYGNGTYVAVGDGTSAPNVAVQTSSDGINWTSRQADVNSVWSGVTYGNGLFVAVGVDDNWSTGVAMSSPDGINWTSVTLPANTVALTSITFGHGHFVTVGYGLDQQTTQWTLSSPDGVSWSLGVGGSDGYWKSVTFGNGIFVATGQRGSAPAFNNVMTSSDDGAHWTLRATSQDQLWVSVAYGNGLFVAVSQFGVMTSSDAITWVASPSVNNDGWSVVVFANGKFVMSGYGSNYQGLFAVSTDGYSWKYQTIQTPRQWTGAVWGADKVVFVNYNGAKLYSNLIDSVPSYEIALSNLDYNDGLPVSTYCDSCVNAIHVQFQRSDNALLDVPSVSSVSVSLTSNLGGIVIDSGGLLALNSSGYADFYVHGPGDGSSVGHAATFHAAVTSPSGFVGLSSNLTVNYVADDHGPTVSSISRFGGQLVTITPAQNANPDYWDVALTVDPSNQNPATCDIDSSQLLSIYPQNGSPYTEQHFASGAWLNSLSWYSSGQDSWSIALFKDVNGIPTTFLIPTVVNGCSYTLTVGDYRQQFEPTATTHQFTYMAPSLADSDASLASAQIKNDVLDSLGAPATSLSSVAPATVALPEMVANVHAAATLFAPTQNTASVDKVVKFSSGATVSTATFDAATAYADEAVLDGDSFVVRVVSRDGSKLYYRFNTTVDSYSALDFYLTNASFGPTVVGRSMTQDVYINKNLQHSSTCGCGFFNPVISADTQDFTIDASDCDPLNQIYLPGDTCKLVITFHPTRAGQRLAKLSVLVGWDGDMGQEYLTIKGSGLAPPATQTAPFVWSSHSAGALQSWNSISSSADGTHLAAVIRNGDIYTSTDSGAHWVDQASAGTRDWYSIASSSDGSRLAATSVGGDIYTSTDFGNTWVDRPIPQSTDYQSGNAYNCWVGITSSSDGMYLAAIDNGCSDGGNIFTSADGGATWIDRSSQFGMGSYSNKVWNNIVSSNDGMHLVATNTNSGNSVFFSGDGGASWSESTSLPALNSISALASNSDGSRVLALPAVNDLHYGSGVAHDVFLTTDFGKTWSNIGPSVADHWNSVATSYDGSHIVLAASGGQIYLSTDFAATWQTSSSTSTLAWSALALSSDGELVTAAGTNTDIWTRRSAPVPAPASVTAAPAPAPRTDDSSNVTPIPKPEVPASGNGTSTKPLISPVVLKVYFDSLSHVVKGENLKKLELLAKSLSRFGNSITVTVTGYTQPSQAPKVFDKHLSQNRAAAVAKVLQKFGLNTKVIYKGAGRTAVNAASSRYAQVVASNR